jgi:hypothetical protein
LGVIRLVPLIDENRTLDLSSSLVFGRVQNYIQWTDGWVTEFLVYSKALSMAERQNLEGFAALR